MLETVGLVLAGLFIVLAPGFLFSVVLWPKGTMDVWSRAGVSLSLGLMLLLYNAFAMAKMGSLTFPSVFLTASALSIVLFIGSLERGGGELINGYVRGAGLLLRGIGAKVWKVAGKLKPSRKAVPPPEIRPPEAVQPAPPEVGRRPLEGEAEAGAQPPSVEERPPETQAAQEAGEGSDAQI